MSDYSNRPEDVPAADWAEQQEDADPAQEAEGALPVWGPPNVDTVEADEADLAEQRVPVFFPDEEG
jgi:hypothetical protein